MIARIRRLLSGPAYEDRARELRRLIVENRELTIELLERRREVTLLRGLVDAHALAALRAESHAEDLRKERRERLARRKLRGPWRPPWRPHLEHPFDPLANYRIDRLLRKANDIIHAQATHPNIQGLGVVELVAVRVQIQERHELRMRSLSERPRLPGRCTCGSGGHPRTCRLHPDRYEEHIAELDAINAEPDPVRVPPAPAPPLVVLKPFGAKGYGTREQALADGAYEDPEPEGRG